MQVTGSSYGYGHTNPTIQNVNNNNNNRTDDFLFEEGNKPNVVVQANVTEPIEPGSTPTIIGALLSTFADEIIGILGGDTSEDVEQPDENVDERVTETAGSGTTSFIA